MVFDAHSDLLYDVTRRRLLGERRVLEHHHLDRLRRGGVEGLVLAVWPAVPERRSGRTPPGRILHPIWAAPIRYLPVPGRPGGMSANPPGPHRSGGRGCPGSGPNLRLPGGGGHGGHRREPRRRGLVLRPGRRLGMLTWNETNALAAGAGGDPQAGLTEAGRRAVRRMGELGMVVDVSHLNDGGFWDVMDLAAGPVIASHSNCRALCDVRRNLSDDQLRRIRDTGGRGGAERLPRLCPRRAPAADRQDPGPPRRPHGGGHGGGACGLRLRLLRVYGPWKRGGRGPGKRRPHPEPLLLAGKAGDEPAGAGNGRPGQFPAGSGGARPAAAMRKTAAPHRSSCLIFCITAV